MGREGILTKQLSRAERPALKAHFRALSEEDLRLRFGTPRTPKMLDDYVDRIDFDRDAVFGVFDDDLKLAGVAHVASMPEGAEFGVSVVPWARGRGIGTALFDRANAHARNHMIRSMFVHCLVENKAMMRIARKAGMNIVAEAGEADAYLVLPPADPSTVTSEFLAERVALFDYALKAQLAAAKRLSEAFVATVGGERKTPED